VISGVLAQGLELGLRSALTPLFLAGRWIGRTPPASADVPVAPSSPLLTAKIVLDELFLASEVVTASIGSLADPDRLRREIRAALDLYRARGWLDAPAAYHPPPPPCVVADDATRRSWGVEFRHVQFASEYEPHAGEPGRDRWLAYEANRTAHAWLLEHPGAPRPWLVCVPAYRMGHPLVDFTAFPAGALHRRWGLNVAIPVMPLHGPRKHGRRSGDGFLSGDYLDTVHWQAQAVWDVRRLLAWLRERGAPAIGIYGLSLGGCTVALLAGLEDDLACVIAGMPAICYVKVARANVPAVLWRLAERLGVPWDDVERLVRVISPLAVPPRVPRERRFMFAAMADRLVSPDDVTALWHHWERPRMAWYAGTHVSFRIEATVRGLIVEALQTSGLIAG